MDEMSRWRHSTTAAASAAPVARSTTAEAATTTPTTATSADCRRHHLPVSAAEFCTAATTANGAVPSLRPTVAYDTHPSTSTSERRRSSTLRFIGIARIFNWGMISPTFLILKPIIEFNFLTQLVKSSFTRCFQRRCENCLEVGLPYLQKTCVLYTVAYTSIPSLIKRNPGLGARGHPEPPLAHYRLKCRRVLIFLSYRPRTWSR